MTDIASHPGRYLRDHVIPKGMSVTEAAKLLDVGRPALSNLLNGNADLSADMAARFERAFGVSAQDLLNRQGTHDAAQARTKGAAASAKAYVPPFLGIKANTIEEWAAAELTARSRLSVMLRTLVNSTGIELTKVSFPGNDDSQAPGWDGVVEAGQGTPWIPAGRSGWEFGVSADTRKKAEGDFRKSVDAVGASARAETTFVFVTPRRWKGKGDWIEERRAEGLWRDVRAYDAVDLEQWLEQSVPGQAWFANERGLSSNGVFSLDEAWRRWSADCDPPLSPELFAPAVSAHRKTVMTRLAAGSDLTIISADSRDEVFGFLSCLFRADDEELGRYRDQVVIFSNSDALRRLASSKANFIPVVLDADTERELAPYRSTLHCFALYPRNAANAQPDIVLEGLNASDFTKALEAMGLTHDKIDQLSRASGNSPTVLRRQLSKLPHIRTPAWASDERRAAQLIPLILAGAWNADNAADRFMMEQLSECSYEQLERDLPVLIQLEDPPVWSAGKFRGLISKHDALFAVAPFIVARDIERFFEVATVVLSEDDPALELEEAERWLAGIYDKKREISGALRNGIGETLVLLSVFGRQLFSARTGLYPDVMAAKLVSDLLSPLTPRVLEAQSSDLALYAEAAPEKFLDIIEADLAKPEPACLELMRPMGDPMFSRAPRTGLTWALETLAWAPERFVRTVRVLARLAERPIDDNLMNKPANSLSSIFRCWMPQTVADLEKRKQALSLLADRFPDVAWPICIEQFEPGSQIGHHNSKPKWRPDAHGRGAPVTWGEAWAFADHAFELALGWKTHTRDTIGDLIASTPALLDQQSDRVWDLLVRWAETATSEDQAWVREKIRVSCFTQRARKRGRKREGVEKSSDRAREVYNFLEPSDPVLRYEWLFRQHWVQEAPEEFQEEEYDFKAREERVERRRKEALTAIWSDQGAPGIIRLAALGDAGYLIGYMLKPVIAEDHATAKIVARVLSDQSLGLKKRNSILAGALASLGEGEDRILGILWGMLSSEAFAELMLQAPFRASTWARVEAQGPEAKQEYWEHVEPSWSGQPVEEMQKGVEELLNVGRARAAFAFTQFRFEEMDPKQVFKVVKAAAGKTADADSTYLLDPYRVKEAIELISKSGQVPVSELAGLEFLFVEVFSRERDRLINLEKEMNANSDLFVQAVAFVFKRSDGGQDPDELESGNPEQKRLRAEAAYKMLRLLKFVPGTKDGEVNSERLIAWIEKAQSALRQLGRSEVGDICIGELLAAGAQEGEDGVWPARPVRDALEEVCTEKMASGICTGLYNSRGVHWRGDGGGAERALAHKYEGWARAMEFTHPRVAAIMRDMAAGYMADAEREDNEARIRRRLRP